MPRYPRWGGAQRRARARQPRGCALCPPHLRGVRRRGRGLRALGGPRASAHTRHPAAQRPGRGLRPAGRTARTHSPLPVVRLRRQPGRAPDQRGHDRGGAFARRATPRGLPPDGRGRPRTRRGSLCRGRLAGRGRRLRAGHAPPLPLGRPGALPCGSAHGGRAGDGGASRPARALPLRGRRPPARERQGPGRCRRRAGARVPPAAGSRRGGGHQQRLREPGATTDHERPRSEARAARRGGAH